MTPEQKAAFLAHAREQGHDWSDYGFTAPAKTEPQKLSKEQQFRQETAKREALPENQIGAKATDPDILRMIEEENELVELDNYHLISLNQLQIEELLLKMFLNQLIGNQ